MKRSIRPSLKPSSSTTTTTAAATSTSTGYSSTTYCTPSLASPLTRTRLTTTPTAPLDSDRRRWAHSVRQWTPTTTTTVPLLAHHPHLRTATRTTKTIPLKNLSSSSSSLLLPWGTAGAAARFSSSSSRATNASGGGGWWRRYWRVESRMQYYLWTTPDTQPYPPLTLFNFADSNDAADARTMPFQRSHDGWKLADDRVMGGYSQSRAQLRVDQGDDDNHQEPTENETNENDSTTTDDDSTTSRRPYLRWEGVLDTTVGLDNAMSFRSGFCALLSPSFPFNGADLRGSFEALEITCRTDGRIYALQLQMANRNLPHERYQAHIHTTSSAAHTHAPAATTSTTSNNTADTPPPQLTGPWERLYLPFDDFALAFGGYSHSATGKRPQTVENPAFRQLQRRRRGGGVLDNRVQIESIIVTLMDNQNGPFCFDLAQIRAVNFDPHYDDEFAYQPPAEDEEDGALVWEGPPTGTGQEEKTPSPNK